MQKIQRKQRKIRSKPFKLTKEQQARFAVAIANTKFPVYISGLGSFEVVTINARTMYHNLTNKVITTKPYQKIKFKPIGKIDKVINK